MNITNIPGVGPSWIPKLGGLLFLIGGALHKHPNASVAWWSEPVMGIGVYLISWFSRQNGVSSEQVGAVKPTEPAAAKQVVGLLLACAILGTGCASKVLPGNDPVIVRAQQTRAMAFDVIDSYLKLEYRNHEYLKLVSPDFARVANRLIAGNKQWFKSFDAVLSAYKSSRTEDAKSKVISAAAVLETALLETQACLAQAAAEGVTP